jgi:hypothetical protein
MLYNTMEVTGLIIITFAVSCMGAYLGVIAHRHQKMPNVWSDELEKKKLMEAS